MVEQATEIRTDAYDLVSGWWHDRLRRPGRTSGLLSRRPAAKRTLGLRVELSAHFTDQPIPTAIARRRRALRSATPSRNGARRTLGHESPHDRNRGVGHWPGAGFGRRG